MRRRVEPGPAICGRTGSRPSRSSNTSTSWRRRATSRTTLSRPASSHDPRTGPGPAIGRTSASNHPPLSWHNRASSVLRQKTAARRRPVRTIRPRRPRSRGTHRLVRPGLRTAHRSWFNRDVTVTVVNPATEETIATLPSAGIDEADSAVARALAAFPTWRAVAPADRARLLRRLASLVEEHGEELARIESENVGKPITGARGEVGMVSQVFHYYAGAVDKHFGETIPVAGGVDLTFREPLGVVGLIVPWNFPVKIASWKLGPALACGNTVVR